MEQDIENDENHVTNNQSFYHHNKTSSPQCQYIPIVTIVRQPSPKRALQPISNNVNKNAPRKRLCFAQKTPNIEDLELEEFKNQRIKFSTFIKLPKFRSIFHQQDALTFYCMNCRKSKPIVLKKPDKARLIDHISTPCHKNSLLAPIIEDLSSEQAITREKIFSNFYFVSLNDNNRYFCEYCLDVFPIISPYSHIREHERTIKHLSFEKQTFGEVFSHQVTLPDDFDILNYAKIPEIINHNAKIESLEEKKKIMETVLKELEIIYPGIFDIEVRTIQFQNGELNSTRFICTKCRLQIDPSVYSHYLKRNSICHLKSERHRKCESGELPPKYEEITCEIPPIEEFDFDDPAAPRYCHIDLAVRAARLVVQKNFSFNSIQTDHKDYLEMKLGRVFTPKMVVRGLIELSNRIFDILKRKIVDRRVAFMIDETIKKSGRYIGLIVVSLDEPDGKVKFFKMNIKYIPDGIKCDAQYINNYVADITYMIWPEGPRPDQVVSLISDAVSYMDSAANSIKAQPETQYMIHIKCLVHAVHRVAEELRSLNPELSNFCSWFQSIYFNSCSLNREADLERIIRFRFDKYYKPPKFFYIRWTTWIETCNYHRHYWIAIIIFVQELETPMKNGRSDQNSMIFKLKNLLFTKGGIVLRQLCFVVDCFTKLNEALRQLESPKSLSAAIGLVQKLIDYIFESCKKYEGDANHIEEMIKSVDIYKKLIMVLDNNKDLPMAVMNSKDDPIYENLPLTSAPIEDWFSMFRFTQSEYRPFAPELTCHYVFCKTNITRYILTINNKEKRKKSHHFDSNFNPGPKPIVEFEFNSIGESDCKSDLLQLMKSIETRRHTKITSTPSSYKGILNFPEIPDISNISIENIENSGHIDSISTLMNSTVNLQSSLDLDTPIAVSSPSLKSNQISISNPSCPVSNLMNVSKSSVIGEIRVEDTRSEKGSFQKLSSSVRPKLVGDTISLIDSKTSKKLNSRNSNLSNQVDATPKKTSTRLTTRLGRKIKLNLKTDYVY